MTQQAQDAIYAARYMRKNQGRFAARRWCEKRGILALYRLACQLEAVENA